MSLHYLAKCQTSHLSRRRHWPIAWSTLIEPDIWPPNSPDLNPINCVVWDALQTMVYQRREFTTIRSRWLSLGRANCSSVWLIAPLVSGVGGLSASSSSKTDTLNIWCENSEMWQLLWTITETINRLFFVVNFFTMCCYRYCLFFNCCF